MTTRKCVFCDGEASIEDTDISLGQQIFLTFCCKKCDRSFSEIFEYSRTENAAGDEVDDETPDGYLLDGSRDPYS